MKLICPHCRKKVVVPDGIDHVFVCPRCRKQLKSPPAPLRPRCAACGGMMSPKTVNACGCVLAAIGAILAVVGGFAGIAAVLDGNPFIGVIAVVFFVGGLLLTWTSKRWVCDNCGAFICRQS